MPTITPVNGPVSQTSASTPTPTAQSARERAIALLSGQNQAQATPVADPNKIAPEDVTALKTGTTPEAPEGQSHKEEATAPKEDSVPLSAQYAKLARQEKAIRAKANEVKALEAQLKAREEALKAKEASPPTSSKAEEELQSLKAKIETDAVSLLLEQGYTIEQIANLALNPVSPEVKAQKAEIARLEKKFEALERSQEEARKRVEEGQTQAYKQAVEQIRKDAAKLVESSPDTYEAIKSTGSVNDIVDLIERTFKEDGDLLSVEEAAAQIEEYLAEEAFKLTKLKKIQSRLQPATPAPKNTESASAQQPANSLKTLTNATGTSRPLTARERAILAFKGELNK